VPVCVKCGKTESIGWYFCKKCQVHMCYSCASVFLGLNPCPVCGETKHLVKVR
jgi:hypothetical protein